MEILKEELDRLYVLKGTGFQTREERNEFINHEIEYFHFNTNLFVVSITQMIFFRSLNTLRNQGEDKIVTLNGEIDNKTNEIAELKREVKVSNLRNCSYTHMSARSCIIKI